MHFLSAIQYIRVRERERERARAPQSDTSLRHIPRPQAGMEVIAQTGPDSHTYIHQKSPVSNPVLCFLRTTYQGLARPALALSCCFQPKPLIRVATCTYPALLRIASFCLASVHRKRGSHLFSYAALSHTVPAARVPRYLYHCLVDSHRDRSGTASSPSLFNQWPGDCYHVKQMHVITL